ncbi:MAG TPA: LLM class flavin-dependent oxidoreductase [Mycobacteriales bacterium]|jgi:luciferase family oxidoreductase group 1
MTLPHIPLSVLDLASVGTGTTPGQALHDSVELARRAEHLGYHRFWVAEHHGMPGIASSAPAILIGQVAAATDRIRVGSGGVMLPNHPPLVVAEQFGTLEAMYPGRIDLGIGRAPGTDPHTARALRRSTGPLSADDFPRQLSELVAFFRGEFPEGHPYRSVVPVPGQGYEPAIWLLGSSGYSAQVAGLLGLPFAFAHHFSAENTLPALHLYRENFRPSPLLAEPYAMIAVSVVAADTDERAEYLARSGELSFLQLRRGTPGTVPTPEEAASYPYSEMELAVMDDRRSQQAVGGPDTVRRRLADLLEQTQVNELMVTNIVHAHADRVRSLEIVRELFAEEAADLR